MMQQPDSVSDYDSRAPAGADLGILLLRYSELSRDVARLHRLLHDLSQHVDSRAQGPRSELLTRHLSGRRAQISPSRASPRRSTEHDDLRLVRSRLERACVIALMEASEPVSSETIYDRIERRGSFTFARYKYPIRAIVLAMGAMVRRGEAVLCNEGGRRRWRWEPRPKALQQPPILTSPDSPRPPA